MISTSNNNYLELKTSNKRSLKSYQVFTLDTCMAQPLKEIFFQPQFFNDLAAEIKKTYPEFKSKEYIQSVFDNNWQSRELKSRLIHAARMLKPVLPTDYTDALNILTPVSQKFTGFDAILFCQFVEEFGQNNFEASIKALEIMTIEASAEGAIRPFIIRYPQKTMEQMLRWSQHTNEHVRRLASEGCRPLLPWNIRLNQFVDDPTPIIPILENLKNDPSKYVCKSVANNLNDISKHQPDLVLDLAEHWYGQSKQTDWIIKHGLRTLLKQGNQQALALFGLTADCNVEIIDLQIEPQIVTIGNGANISFSLVLNSHIPKQLRLEFLIHYIKKNGALSKKVFQLSEKEYVPKQTYTLKRNLSFRNLTTRQHYPGRHLLEIAVNGQVKKSAYFQLNR